MASEHPALERGIAAFNAGRIAAAEAHFSEVLDAQPRHAAARHFRALARQRLSRPKDAWADMRAALAREPRSAALRLSAARLLEALGRREHALAQAQAAARLRPRDAEALELRARLEAALGRDKAAARSRQRALRERQRQAQEREPWRASAAQGARALERWWLKSARRAVERLLADGSPSAERHLEAAGLLSKLDERGAALEQCEAALRLEPRLDPALRFRCELLASMALRTSALRALPPAVAAAPDPARARLWAASVCGAMGEFEDERRHLREAARRDAGLAEAWSGLARLALWRGRAREAAAAAERARAAGAHQAETLRLRGAAAVLAGRYRAALADLDAAVRLAPRDAEARVWRAEALRRGGQPGAAVRALARGPRTLGALINLVLARHALGQTPPLGESREVFALVPWRQLGLAQPERPSEEALTRVLSLMRGNRSETQTYARPGGGIEREPRFHLMELQAALRFGDAGLVLAEFDRQIARAPRSSYLRSSRGEVCLWVGRYDEAQRDLEEALRLDPRSPWPNVGLCGAYALRGDLERAALHLERAAANRAAEPVLATWRGELLRRQGRPREALDAFSRADSGFPLRLSLWLNVGLALGESGDERGQRSLYARLRRHAAPLLAAAGDGRARPARVLERALALMKGNRSSWLYTWVEPSGRVRHVALTGLVPSRIPAALRHSAWAFDARPA